MDKGDDKPVAPVADRAAAGRRERLMLAVLAVVAAAAALRAARGVLIPICVAIFLAVMLWPVQRRLMRRLPAWWAASVVGVGLVVVSVAAGMVVALILGSAKEDLAGSVSRLWEGVARIKSWVEERGFSSAWLPARPGEGNGLGLGLSEETMARIAAFVGSGLTGTLGILGAVTLTLFLTVLALGEAPHWDDRLERVFGRERARGVADAFEEASGDFGRYLGATTVSGASAGVLTAVLCWAVGVPMPLVWGLLSFLLNYVPNIGVFLSGIPPALLAFVHVGVGGGLAVVAGLVVIEMVTGNVLAPVLTGRAMCLSPLTVMAAVLLWSWLWGAAGALMAAPMTVAMIIAMRRYGPTRHVAELLIDREGSKQCASDERRQ